MKSFIVAGLVVVTAAFAYYFLDGEIGSLRGEEKGPPIDQQEDQLRGGEKSEENSSVGPSKSVIVVGGGLAGLSAAVEAYRGGAYVILLDKEPKFGGNSQKATSGINACPTAHQTESGIADSLQHFKRDVLKSGDYGVTDNDISISEALVNQLTERSVSAVEFLESFGLQLSTISEGGGHSHARTHRAPSKPVGWTLTSTLINYLQKEAQESDRLILKTGAGVTDLDIKDGHITGVMFADEEGEHDLRADAVVLTMGGYGANKNILDKYAPYAVNFPTSNGKFAVGDGLALGEKVGAKLIDLNRVQIHPTSFVEPENPLAITNILCPEMLRGAGGILVNERGERFVNELGLRAEVTEGITKNSRFPLKGVDMSDESLHVPPTALLIMNDAAVNKVLGNIKFYTKKGFVSEYEDATALADSAFETNEAKGNLLKTLQSYAKHAESGEMDEFGKTNFPETILAEEKLYAMKVTPAVHYTMGGLAIDTDARVQSASGGVVEGLFAAGEVTGGVHGVNRLVGNSLLECVVFGRQAGQSATAER